MLEENRCFVIFRMNAFINSKRIMSQFVLTIWSIILIKQILAFPVPNNCEETDDSDDTVVISIETNIHNIEDLLEDYKRNLIDLSSYGENLYGIPDTNVTAQLVTAYSINITDRNNINPEELGTYVEGDILIPKTAANIRNGLVTVTARWPNAIIPYSIDGNFNKRDLLIIERALNAYHRYTCIRFVKRTDETDYLSFVSGYSGCWSAVGRVGGRQELNLQSPGCVYRPGTVIHEVMHALGFLHEQNREERDEYVTIQYENIEPHATENFSKANRTLNFGIEYDYGSIMHYSPKAFSINGLPTIIPTRFLGNKVMGQREGFSANDIHKLNSMYDCTGIVNEIENSVVNSFVNGFLTGLGYNY